jgi:transcriptional regulator with XRE-family HTH domain
MSSNLESTGDKIRALRENRQLPLRKIAAQLDIDTSFYSKIERGVKKATKSQIQQLEVLFGLKRNTLMVNYLAEIVLNEISHEDCAKEVIRELEKKILIIRNKKCNEKKIESN